MILVYLIIAAIFAFMMLIDAHESELDFFRSWKSTVLTYSILMILSLCWPMLLAVILYNTLNPTADLDR